MGNIMRTVIIGVGNPVRCDDGVGLHVARQLRARVGESVDVVQLCAGGLRLVEAMVGYDRAVIIDAIASGGSAGTIYKLDPGGLRQTRNAASTHDGSLPEALELARAAGLDLPAEIRIWAVEADDLDTFSESLTPQVARAAVRVADRVWKEVVSV